MTIHSNQAAVYIIPFDGVGGVETAARTLANTPGLAVIYIHSSSNRGFLCSLLGYIRAFQVVRRYSPSSIITSLWRAHIVGIACRVLLRKSLVTFLHLPHPANILDRIVTDISLSLSSSVWADSITTLNRRAAAYAGKKSSIISMKVDDLSAYSYVRPAFDPSFVFWGRLVPQKCIVSALQIFHRIHVRYPNARFVIMGPDSGHVPRFYYEIDSLGLGDCVFLRLGLPRDQILRESVRYTFFLQTSLVEGACISVQEALSLGLIPVVTPVGEIGNYCHDEKNALIIESVCGDQVVEKLTSNESSIRELSLNATKTFQAEELYSTSFIKALQDL